MREARWYLTRFNRKIIGKSIELQMKPAEMSRSDWRADWLNGKYGSIEWDYEWKMHGRARFLAADSGSEKVSREEENGNE